MNNYRNLLIWKKAVEFTVLIYQETDNFPKTEVYVMTSQIRRAASSIAANIAEGAGRNSNKEFIHFLSIALGSIYEVETFLTISKELGFINEKKFENLLTLTFELDKMIRSLQKTKTN